MSMGFDKIGAGGDFSNTGSYDGNTFFLNDSDGGTSCSSNPSIGKGHSVGCLFYVTPPGSLESSIAEFIGGYYPLSVGSVAMRFNGSTWELVGEYPNDLPGGDSNPWDRQHLVIDDADTLYVAHVDNSGQPGVDKNSGSGGK